MWDLKNSASLLIDGVLCLCLFHNRPTVSVCVIYPRITIRRDTDSKTNVYKLKTTKLPVYVLVTGNEIKSENFLKKIWGVCPRKRRSEGKERDWYALFALARLWWNSVLTLTAALSDTPACNLRRSALCVTKPGNHQIQLDKQGGQSPQSSTEGITAWRESHREC